MVCNNSRPRIRIGLSKGDLCRIFGKCNLTNGTCYYSSLRDEIMTDEVLKELGIPIARYNSIKGKSRFTYLETLRIIQYFNIEESEYSN